MSNSKIFRWVALILCSLVIFSSARSPWLLADTDENKTSVDNRSEFGQFVVRYSECLLDEKWDDANSEKIKLLIDKLRTHGKQNRIAIIGAGYDRLFFRLQKVAVKVNRLEGGYFFSKQFMHLNEIAQTNDANRQCEFLCDTIEFVSEHANQVNNIDGFFIEMSLSPDARLHWDFAMAIENATSIESVVRVAKCVKRNADLIARVNHAIDWKPQEYATTSDFFAAIELKVDRKVRALRSQHASRSLAGDSKKGTGIVVNGRDYSLYYHGENSAYYEKYDPPGWQSQQQVINQNQKEQIDRLFKDAQSLVAGDLR